MKTMIENFKKFAILAILVFGLNAYVSAQSKTVVKISDLQKSITDQIAKDYTGYTIKNAYKIDKNKVVTYDVNVIKGKETLCLAFNNSGKFLKVIEPKNKTNNKTSTNSKTTSMVEKNHAIKPQK
jgi:hypothetical protein